MATVIYIYIYIPLLAHQIALCRAAWLPPTIVPAWSAEDPGEVKFSAALLSLPGVQKARERQSLFLEPYRQFFVPAWSAEGPGVAGFVI